ncbi:MAG: hypothetical protein AAB638_01260 [Patescibacteria group bacterium]
MTTPTKVPRVLVVDTDTGVSGALSRVLEELHITIYTTASAESARISLRTFAIDLLVVFLRFGFEQQGSDLIRDTIGQVPVIACGPEGYIPEGVTVNADYPISTSQLTKMIQAEIAKVKTSIS